MLESSLPSFGDESTKSTVGVLYHINNQFEAAIRDVRCQANGKHDSKSHVIRIFHPYCEINRCTLSRIYVELGGDIQSLRDREVVSERQHDPVI